MEDFTKLPNIGKVLAQKLKTTGYKSYAELKADGAEKVFLRLKTIDDSICINCLYALDATIKGVRR